MFIQTTLVCRPAYGLSEKKKSTRYLFRRSPAIIQNLSAQPLSSLIDKIIRVRKCEAGVTENRNVYKIS